MPSNYVFRAPPGQWANSRRNLRERKLFIEAVASGGVTNFVSVTGSMGAGTLSGALGPWTYGKALDGAMTDTTGALSRFTSRSVDGVLAAGNLVGTAVKKTLLNSLSGVLAAASLAGAVVASKCKVGAATLLGGGTLIVSGLNIAVVDGGRLYIEVYDSLGNKLGSGPIYQIQQLSFTKRLDRGGDFAFSIPASDDRATLIQQGREIRVFRQGEGEIFRGLIEKSMWDVKD